MKKLKVFGLLALILAFGLFLSGCSSDTEPESWSKFTSLDQLNGTWKGSGNKKHTYKEWQVLWGRTWGAQEDDYYGNMSMEVKLELIFAINSAARTNTETSAETRTFSGGKVNDIWEEFKTTFPGNPIINDKNHSSTLNESREPYSISESTFGNVQINQTGKKIKMVNFWGDGTDFIMSKQ